METDEAQLPSARKQRIQEILGEGKKVRFDFTVLSARYLPPIKHAANEKAATKTWYHTRIESRSELLAESHNVATTGGANEATATATTFQSAIVGPSAAPEFNCSRSFEKQINELTINELISQDIEIRLVGFTEQQLLPEPRNGVTIGYASISLFPLLTPGVTSIDEWVPTQPANVDEQGNQVELHVKINISESIFDEATAKKSNFLTVSVQSIENLPQSWKLKQDQKPEDHLFRYIVSFSVPILKDVQMPYALRRQGKLALIAKDNNDASAESAEQQQQQQQQEQQQQQQVIVFNGVGSSQTFFLNESALQVIEQFATDEKPFTVKIRRILNKQKTTPGAEPTTQTIPDDWIDQNEEKYRGVASIPLRDLLEPGQKTISGKFQIEPNSFPLDKEPVAESASRPSTPVVELPPVVEKGGKKAPEKKPPATAPAGKKGKKPDMPAELIKEPDEEVHPYLKEGTNIVLSLSLHRSIIPLPKDRPRPNLKPSDIIPRRKKIDKKHVDATEKYKKDLSSVVDMLAEEYLQAMTKDGEKVDKDKFIYNLNVSGKYYSIHEKLKSSVVRIVKEKFNKTDNAPPASKDEMGKFYNDLYVYLNEQMHVVINRLFAKTIEEESPEILGIDGTPTDKWKRLADEAELMMNLPLAAKYHQERLAHSPEDPDLWYEYGAFSARVSDMAKAEQSFREAIAIDMQHLKSLLAYGVLLCVKGQFKEAEVFLQAAVDVDLNNVLSWGVLALYFEFVDKERDAQQAYKQATKLFEETRTVTSNNNNNNSNNSKKDTTSEVSSVRMVVAQFLLDLHAHTLVERVLNQELQLLGSAGRTPQVLIGFAKMYMQREDYDHAEEKIQEAIKINSKATEAWILLGHLHYLRNRIEDAEGAYEMAVLIGKEPPVPALYIRLGEIYLKLKKYEDAKDTYLLACKFWPCSISWLGVGITYYRMGDLRHAEQAFNEANIQNNLNPVVWGYLCMICLRERREAEAEQALREALRQNLHDPEVLREIGSLQIQNGQIKVGEATLNKSLAIRESTATKMALAGSLSARGQYEEAIRLYEQVLNKTDDPEERHEAILQLHTIMTSLDRADEAERYAAMLDQHQN